MSALEIEGDNIVLYRPVGQAELDLIVQSGFKRFPPRLPIQPIFYPVTNELYAEQIARGWNTKDKASGYAGYVTRFRVKTDHVMKYPVQIVGTAVNSELWVPAEELEEFNDNIVGEIEVISEFRGEAPD